MKKILFILLLLQVTVVQAQKEILVSGDVSNLFTNEGIPNAKAQIILKDSLVVLDSCRTKLSLITDVTGNVTSTHFDKNSGAGFKLYLHNAVDCRVVIEADGYMPYAYDIPADELQGKKIYELGSLQLHPEPKEQTLNEVVVSATKIKMFYKGDTVVYNADAFDVAQSETLRELIEQLPGTEFRDGRVYVNGRYVENLLLNGKNFFNGNIVAALDNLPAYVIDKVKVYDRSGELTEMTGKDMHDSKYVMDLSLKREYIGTWLLQASGGAGTAERYQGLGYLMRMDDRQMFSLNLDANNINTKREVTSRGARMSIGMSGKDYSVKSATLNYYMEPDRKFRFSINGNVDRVEQVDKIFRNHETFLPTVNMMSRSETLNSTENTAIKAGSSLTFRPLKNQSYNLQYSFNFTDNNTLLDNKSLSFYQPGKSEWENLSIDSIIRSEELTEKKELLYSLFSPSLNERVGIEHKVLGSANFSLGGNILSLKSDFIHNTDRVKEYDNYNLTYFSGADNDRQRRYGNSRDYAMNAGVALDFIYKFLDSKNNNAQVIPYISYLYNSGTMSHPLYRLERIDRWLEDTPWNAASLGTIPPTELLEQCIDEENSYYSRTIGNTVSAGVRFMHKSRYQDKSNIRINASVELSYNSKRLNYDRSGDISSVQRKELLFKPTVSIDWYPCKGDLRGSVSRWNFSYSCTPEMPQLMQLLTIRNTTDPLNKHYGNSGLKNEYRHKAGFAYNYNHKEKKIAFNCSTDYTYTANDITTMSAYDTATGVRTYTPVNTSKTNVVNSNIGFSMPLDKNERFYLRLGTGGYYSQYMNLASFSSEPTEGCLTRNYQVAPTLQVDYNVNKFNACIAATPKFNYIKQKKYSDRYNDIILTGETSYTFPFDVRFSTRFDAYITTGYSNETMNGFKPIWNINISRAFFNNKLNVELVANDILARQNSISATVDANGRTEILREHLSRYFMLNISYKFNWSEKSKVCCRDYVRY